MAEKRTAAGKAAKNRYTNEYKKKAYDRIALYVPKGTRDTYRAMAQERGISVTALFVNAVSEYVENHPVQK